MKNTQPRAVFVHSRINICYCCVYKKKLMYLYLYRDIKKIKHSLLITPCAAFLDTHISLKNGNILLLSLFHIILWVGRVGKVENKVKNAYFNCTVFLMPEFPANFAFLFFHYFYPTLFYPTNSSILSNIPPPFLRKS